MPLDSAPVFVRLNPFAQIRVGPHVAYENVLISGFRICRHNTEKVSIFELLSYSYDAGTVRLKSEM